MKKHLLPLFLIATIITTAFSLKFKKRFIPPGTIQINDTLFADDCEISNFSWQEYEWWTVNKYGKKSKEHLATLPDTLVWRNAASYNEPYVEHYYRHVAYRDYPVVGISYEQALAYCKWRTYMVKLFLSNKNNFTYQNFEYRLPTLYEWEMLAESSMSVFHNNGKNAKGKYEINCAHPKDTTLPAAFLMEHADVTCPITSYPKNHLGLYNLVGNVAEMVYEKGICKGGGWKNNLEECRIGKNSFYSSPNSWTVFRCV